MALITGGPDCLTGMSQSILAAFVAAGCQTNAGMLALSHGLAVAIVTEITTNAVVVPTMTAPPGGGPIVGTGTVT